MRRSPAVRFALVLVTGGSCMPTLLHSQLPSLSVDSLTINDLRTPTSPAFIILGIEPTAVERPTTPRALALGLVSATDGGTVIPENYALEFAPYWLNRHPNLTFDDYFHARGIQAIKQTFSLSFATSRGGEDSTITNVGGGFRVIPVPGRTSRLLERIVTEMDSIQAVGSQSLVPELGEAEEALEEDTLALEDARIAGDEVRVRELTQKVRADRERLARAQEKWLAMADTLSKLARRFETENQERVGFIFQLAGAVGATYPQNDFSAGQLNRLGAWTTLSYRLEEPSGLHRACPLSAKRRR